MKKDTARQRVYKRVREILERYPQGLNYSEIIKILHETLPDIKINTLHGSMWDLKQLIDKGKVNDLARPAKGIYILSKYMKEKVPGPTEKPRIKEESFYKSFADYLINDLEECTRAIALGGNKFGDKWGTPDVLGIYRFSEADPIKPPLEIVSAEIKTDLNQLITAFGQACAYKLFSHKVYLVIPKDAEQDISRIESLCLRFGIGLILFDPRNPDNPNFLIRSRAVKSEPDYFYVNKYIKLLGEEIHKLLL